MCNSYSDKGVFIFRMKEEKLLESLELDAFFFDNRIKSGYGVFLNDFVAVSKCLNEINIIKKNVGKLKRVKIVEFACKSCIFDYQLACELSNT